MTFERPSIEQAPGLLEEVRIRLKGLLRVGAISRNAIFVLVQTGITILCTFVVYRILIGSIGIERFGVWSLLLAGSSLARLGDVSGGGALSRFVALGHAKEDEDLTRSYIHTVILTSLILNGILALLLLGLGRLALSYFIDPQFLSEADRLLPFAAAVLITGALAAAVLAAVDGCQRADQRAIVASVASVSFLAVSWFVVPAYGTVGFGAALILQQLIMTILGWLQLRRHVPNLGWLPTMWRRDIFLETAGFALKSNAIGAAGMFFEPLAKFAFNSMGGLALVGYYEIAARLVVQARSLVIAAAAPLIAAFARVSVGDRAEFNRLVHKTTVVAAWGAIAITLATLAASPIVSKLVFGRIDMPVLLMVAALAVGWNINIMCAPLYFAATGRGILRWNFISHVAAAVTTLAGAMAPVEVFGWTGMVLALVTGLLISAIVVLVGNTYALSLQGVVSRMIGLLLGSALAIIAICGTFAVAVLALVSQ